MKIMVPSVIMAAAALVAGECMAVAGSLDANGQPIANTWLIQPGDRYSGTVFLSGSGGTCSGTLIAPTVVLTAAHCNRAAQGTAFFVDNSANNWDGQFTGISVRSFVSHPGWAGSVGNGQPDIALAFLSTPAPTTARISSFYSDPQGMAYTGSVLLGGFGNTRSQTTGLVERSGRDSMFGTIDGVGYFANMPYLNAATNYLRAPSGSKASLVTAQTDLDHWFPRRINVSGDDQTFNFYTQRSPYGFQQQLVNGKIQFKYGGFIPFASLNEGTTLSGDSGSAVFLNRRALIESYLWHVAYDEMMAAGGVPDEEILGALGNLYQDDTNYLVGVTSYTWTLPELARNCPTETSARASCFSNWALAGQGGGGYTLLQPFLSWISETMDAFGAGSIRVGSLTALDGVSGAYQPPESVAAFMVPPTDDLGLVRVGQIPEPATISLALASLFLVVIGRRRAQQR